nr:hypothetical protein Iba_chr03cCG2970 [Ipomoea batatas]
MTKKGKPLAHPASSLRPSSLRCPVARRLEFAHAVATPETEGGKIAVAAVNHDHAPTPPPATIAVALPRRKQRKTTFTNNILTSLPTTATTPPVTIASPLLHRYSRGESPEQRMRDTGRRRTGPRFVAPPPATARSSPSEFMVVRRSITCGGRERREKLERYERGRQRSWLLMTKLRLPYLEVSFLG